MLTCKELLNGLSDYVDGTLSPAERGEVEAHLSACPACAELARDSAAAENRTPSAA